MSAIEVFKVSEKTKGQRVFRERYINFYLGR